MAWRASLQDQPELCIWFLNIDEFQAMGAQVRALLRAVALWNDTLHSTANGKKGSAKEDSEKKAARRTEQPAVPPYLSIRIIPLLVGTSSVHIGSDFYRVTGYKPANSAMPFKLRLMTSSDQKAGLLDLALASLPYKSNPYVSLLGEACGGWPAAYPMLAELLQNKAPNNPTQQECESVFKQLVDDLSKKYTESSWRECLGDDDNIRAVLALSSFKIAVSIPALQEARLIMHTVPFLFNSALFRVM